jgi:hypothetical protein
MKIKIKENAYVFGGNDSDFINKLQKLEGKWVDVETKHLFTNQYNTKELRVYDSMVSAVKYDARINKGKCKYCGTMLNRGEICSKYADCEKYGVEWFTTENTFFLKYPDGLPMVETQVLSYQENSPKIGTYHLESFPSLDYYRLSNCRKTINFKYDGINYFVHNGIGWNQYKRLDVPQSVNDELPSAIDKLIKAVQ